MCGRSGWLVLSAAASLILQRHHQFFVTFENGNKTGASDEAGGVNVRTLIPCSSCSPMIWSSRAQCASDNGTLTEPQWRCPCRVSSSKKQIVLAPSNTSAGAYLRMPFLTQADFAGLYVVDAVEGIDDDVLDLENPAAVESNSWLTYTRGRA